MADNYLEKQREQYEVRKAAWEKAKKFGKKSIKKTKGQSRPSGGTATAVSEKTSKENL